MIRHDSYQIYRAIFIKSTSIIIHCTQSLMFECISIGQNSCSAIVQIGDCSLMFVHWHILLSNEDTMPRWYHWARCSTIITGKISILGGMFTRSMITILINNYSISVHFWFEIWNNVVQKMLSKYVIMKRDCKNVGLKILNNTYSIVRLESM